MNITPLRSQTEFELVVQFCARDHFLDWSYDADATCSSTSVACLPPLVNLLSDASALSAWSLCEANSGKQYEITTIDTPR
jgi:hypothetical protein